MVASLAQNAGGGAAQVADLMPMKSTGALFLGVLRSRTVEDRLVDRFELRKVYGKTLAIDARKKLQDNTTVAEDRRAGIISVSVTDRDPKRAAALCNAYVEELDRLVVELNTSAAHRERVFLETRLRQVKQELDAASSELGDFSSKNATFNVTDQAKAMVEAAAALQGQLIAAESELRGLQQIYTNENVRVRSVQARVAELREQLNKLGGIPPRPGEPVSSGSADDMLYPSLRKLPILGTTYIDLYRHVKIQEAVFETLTKQYELAKVQEVKEVPSVRVLDQAEIPERKSAPHRAVMVLVSMFLSLVGALALLWCRAAWADTHESDPTKAFLTDMFRGIKPGVSIWYTRGARLARVDHLTPHNGTDNEHRVNGPADE
jgi:uncharacterized protein involved in exopolysaccharide biosynthesis